MPGSLTSSDHGKYVCLVYHLDYADPCPEISRDDQLYFLIELVNFEPFLCGDCEVGLVLVEAGVDDLLFVFLHVGIDYKGDIYFEWGSRISSIGSTLLTSLR